MRDPAPAEAATAASPARHEGLELTPIPPYSGECGWYPSKLASGLTGSRPDTAAGQMKD